MPHVPGRRGAFGGWLTGQRERRYRTQAEALAEYRRLAGLVISPSEYAQWESGSRVPKAENPKRLALYAFFGSREDAVTVGAPSDQSALIAALNRQSEAMENLLAQLQEMALANVAFAGQVGRGLARVLRALDPGASRPETQPQQSVPSAAGRSREP